MCDKEASSIETTLLRDTSFGMEVSAQTRRDTAVEDRANPRTDRVVQPDLPSLNALALRSLASLFDEKEQLFVERVTLSKDRHQQDKTSRKQTIIVLLGLHRLVEFGGTQPFDIAAIGNVAFQDRSWVRSAGDLGLLTWFTAVCRPDRLRVIFDEFNFDSALATYADGCEAHTAGLAWFLAGIAHARLASPETHLDLADVAADTYRLLQDNQSDTGIFGHAGSTRFPLGSLYSRFGTFSDQISAIYSLSMFAKAFQVEEPLESALACANSMCTLQGELGQWWFLYDKRNCRVVNRYPVLSLQQDGTGPCALFALEEVTGQSFRSAIFKGLSWTAGANELGNDLWNVDQTFIWDSIGLRGRIAKYWEVALSFLISSRNTDVNCLRIQYEARPDHFGWLLYAFGRFGLPNMAAAACAVAAH